jgi:ABC-type glycerol-3-phosphate transport system substrate-binding protein
LTGAPADLLQGKYSGSPARRSSFNDSQAANAYPWFPALLECIERKNTFPASPKFYDLMGDLYNMSHKVFSGEQTPVEAIQELNRKLELE